MTNEKRLKEAARILAKGGRLVIAKNVAAAIPDAQAPGGVIPFGVEVQVCEWLPEGTVLAISPSSDSLRLRDAFSRPLPED